MPLGARLFLADKAPQFVKLDPVDADADHHAIVQLAGALADVEGKLADGFSIGAGETSGGTNADALCEGGDNLNLLRFGKVVHGGSNPACCGKDPKRDSGKSADYALYSLERSLLRGPIPGL
jgi:hypothetical protein